MSMTKVLFYTEAWGIGGIESFVMNTVETLNRDEFSFDIFSTHDWSDVHDERISQLHGHRYVVFKGDKPGFIKRLLDSGKAWDTLLCQRRYDVVHINAMNGLGFVYSAIAKRHKVPVRIVHSHNSRFGSGSKTVKTIAHVIGKTAFGGSATSRLACSQDAGTYLFGRKKFATIHNGIDTEKYVFDEGKRIEMRQRFGLSQDALVFGAVGRLSEAKNPLFQVDVLCDLCSKNIPAYLLLVGNGPLNEKIRVYAEEKGVTDRLIMPGAATTESAMQVQDYLSMLDVFSMPSAFEGFPIAAIEAYANGLDLALSEAVPVIGDTEDAEMHLPIDDASQWADAIQQIQVQMKAKNRLGNRPEKARKARSLGYDRKQVTRTLEELYQG
jgi:glycosyltransferase involved in cell wall biosynthesis